MTTVRLTPVSALDDAVAKMHATARALLPLVAETLHRQFPAGAWLVLIRPYEYEGYDHVRLDSVRGARGETLYRFEDDTALEEQLPAVPEELAALWGELNPREACDVLELIDRIDIVAPYDVLDFLPEAVQTGPRGGGGGGAGGGRRGGGGRGRRGGGGG